MISDFYLTSMLWEAKQIWQTWSTYSVVTINGFEQKDILIKELQIAISVMKRTNKWMT